MFFLLRNDILALKNYTINLFGIKISFDMKIIKNGLYSDCTTSFCLFFFFFYKTPVWIYLFGTVAIQGKRTERYQKSTHSPQSNFKGALKRSFIVPVGDRGWRASAARNVQVKQLDSAVYLPPYTRRCTPVFVASHIYDLHVLQRGFPPSHLFFIQHLSLMSRVLSHICCGRISGFRTVSGIYFTHKKHVLLDVEDRSPRAAEKHPNLLLRGCVYELGAKYIRFLIVTGCFHFIRSQNFISLYFLWCKEKILVLNWLLENIWRIINMEPNYILVIFIKTISFYCHFCCESSRI